MYDQDGFVQDPQSPYVDKTKYSPTTLDVANNRCLILLGEPGLGKTEALKEDYQRLSTTLQGPDTVLWIDLKDISSDFALSRQLFESALFKQWEQGEGNLYLYLDSFDEGLLAFDALSGFFTQELRRLAGPQITDSPIARADSSDTSLVVSSTSSKTHPLDRLYVRIACRPGIWRPSFSKDLEDIFGHKNVDTFKLLPLTRKDVEIAAAQAGADGFVQQVISRRVVAFSLKPFALTALISLFKQHKALPPKKSKIYKEVCRVASMEHNKSRAEKAKLGQLTPEERLRVARRIAAFTVFCNKSFLRTDLPIEPLEAEELGSDLLYGAEGSGQDQVQINFATLRETLDTGLFAWRGEHRVGWDHRTYSEFLASEYCIMNGLTLKDIHRLVFIGGLSEPKIAQQLYETVAWLCSFYPRLIKAVLKTDPMVLLLSDVLKDDESLRYRVTEKYLARFQREEQFNDQFGSDLALLAHRHLSTQLRPYIIGRKKKYRARTKAMDIAGSCRVQELESDLVAVAHDARETIPTRAHALFVLGRFSSPSARRRLRDLAIATLAEDVHQEVKGWALNATWPDYLSVNELFSSLSSPIDKGFFGGYSSFLHSLPSTLPQRLSGNELLTAMAWVGDRPNERAHVDRFRPVADCILLRAWDELGSPDVRQAFAAIALKRIREHSPIAEGSLSSRREDGHPFYSLLSKDVATRRQLIEALIEEMSKDVPNADAFWLLYCPDHIVRPEDAGWLIENLAGAGPDKRTLMLSILERMTDPESLGPIRSGLDAGVLPETMRPLIFVELGSSLAATLRHYYHEQLLYNQPPEMLNPPPHERLTTLLSRIEGGKPEFWRDVTLTLTLKDDSTHYGDEGNDLRELPGWLRADAPTRERIVKAAEAFLLGFVPKPKEYGQQTFGHWVIAAYLAVVLVYDENRTFFEAQQELFWSRWSSLVLSYRFNYRADMYKDLLRIPAKRFPAALSHGVSESLCPEMSDCYFVNHLQEIWTPEVEKILLERLRTGALDLKCKTTILEVLVQQGSSEGEAIAKSMIEATNDPETQVVGAAVLLTGAADGGESVVWPLIQSSDELGKKIIARVSNFGGNVPFANRWSERSLGELFVWLAKRFPYSKDEKDGGAHWVGESESIRYTRDTILTYLRNRGTREAISALERARRESGLDWLKWHVVEAKTANVWSAWKPITPGELLQLGRKTVDLGPRWLNYLVGALISFVVKILTPADIGAVPTICLTVAAASLVFGLFERNRRDLAWLFPMWVIVLITDIVFFLWYRFL